MLGLIAGALRIRTRSLWPAILLHGLYNASLLTAAQQDWPIPASLALPSALLTLLAGAGLCWKGRVLGDHKP